MTTADIAPTHQISPRTGIFFVLAAGVLWSTVGLGIRMIEDAIVWQILFYRSISLSAFLFLVIWLRSRESPLKLAIKAGLPASIGGLSLVAAYAGGIYAIQTTSVANAMLLFASAPFMAAILGWIVLRESVRPATWIATCVAMTIVQSDGDTSSGRTTYQRCCWMSITSGEKTRPNGIHDEEK